MGVAVIAKHILSRKNHYKCFLLVVLLSAIYLIDGLPFLKKIVESTFLFSYVLKPALWVCLTLIVLYFAKVKPVGKLRFKSYLNSLAFVCAVSYILLMIMGGFLDGFGKSPYSFTPFAIIMNVILVGSTLGGQELARAYLINNLSAKRPFLIISIVSLFFTFINITTAQLLQFKSLSEVAKLAGQNIFPLFSENLLTSYFAYLGGPVTALIYKGTLQAYQWFCPILPNLGWMSKTFLGTFVPFISLIIVQNLYLYESREVKRHSRDKESTLGWILTSVAAVVIVWFAVGLFPIYPQVIATGSMEPLIKPGDVVLAKKIKGQEAKLGDIIHFRHLENKIYIVHRVVDVKTEKGKGQLFQTQGDNNSSADSKLVEPQQIKGKVIQVIPKIGWPTLYLRSEGDPNTDNVEI